MRVLDKAKFAPNLASALNIGAFNLGGAMGAWLGGIVLESPLGLQSLPWVAAVVTLLGLIVTLWSWHGDVKDKNSKKQETCVV
ncbi:hypothetical protein ASL14_19865 [Paenibacillus sp. IHB B 3084]|nr:hypothetical protein ASL14_19865 [Paenibacillus sp. IHB B 3084]